MPTASRWLAAALVAAPLAIAPAASAATTAPTVTATPITKALSSKGARSTVTVANTGATRLTGLTVRAAGLKGVRASISGAKRGVRTLKPLKAGGRVRLTVTLRRAKGGPTSGAFGLRLRQKGKALASGRIAFGPKAKPGPTPESFLDRYYWGSQYGINGIAQYTLLFSRPDFVFTGDAEGTFPTCTATAETCQPYTYDASSKALTVGGKPATISGAQLTLDGQTYFRLGVPTPGARWNTTLTYSNSTGLCPLNCTSFTENLTFLPDGTFVRGAAASGTSPTFDYGAVPPDQKGTYEVRADRTLRLAFADGKERVETLGIFPAEDGTYPANPTAGFVLDGDGYFDISD